MESHPYSRCCKAGLKNLPTGDPFGDLDLMLEDLISDYKNPMHCVTGPQVKLGQNIHESNDIDRGDECEMSLGIFRATQEMLDEFDDKEDRN